MTTATPSSILTDRILRSEPQTAQPQPASVTHASTGQSPQLKRIALLLDVSTSYGRSIYTGIRRALLPRLDVALSVEQASPESVAAWTEQTKPDGVIAAVITPALSNALHEWGGPVVNVSASRRDQFPRIGVDDRRIGELAASYFLGRHYRSFAYIGRPERHYSELRLQGFKQTLSAAGFDCANYEWIDKQSSQPNLIPWLRNQNQPLALFCLGDQHAIQVVQHCQRAGLSIPEPIALLSGIDDEEVCTLSRPTISGIEFPGEQIGYEAASLLDRMLDGGYAPERPLLIQPHRIIERESTEAAAISDQDVAKAMAFIRHHVCEPIGVKEVVNAVQTGRRNLEMKFSRIIGCSIYQHILTVRLSLVKDELSSSDDSLATIAKRTGFAGAQHLCEIFKRKERITPGEFRRHRRQCQAGS